MAETQANDVVLLQQVLIDNLQELGFRSITAESIGDREGKPDGILGNGTGTALNVLAIMAQIEAGVDPNEMTTGYNADSAPLITAYVEKYASPEAAAQFGESIKSVFPGGEFNEDYDEAIIRNDTVARELNVAQFRNMAEGAVSITEGTPPPVVSTAPLNEQVRAMQEVIFTGQILEQIGMQADQIGNYQTGEADGILGKGTSEALQKLVILSERAAGRDGEEITGVYDATLVQTYLEANGVTEEDAQKFVNNAGQLNGNLQTLYAATDVDPATVQLADNGSVADQNTVDSDSRSITMNYAQYEYLSAVATSEAGTAEDNVVAIAYSEALKAKADEIGLTAQEDILKDRQDEYTRMVGADTTGFDTAALEAHLAANEAYKTETESIQKDVDALKAQLHATNIEFTVPEGVGNEQLAAIRTSIASVETQQVAMNVADDALNGSTLGTSDNLGPVLGPVPFSDELDGMPNVFGPSPLNAGPYFDTAIETVGLSREVVSDPSVRTAGLTHDEYDDIKDDMDDGTATDQEKLVVAAYESARDQRAAEIGLTALKAEYEGLRNKNIYAERNEMFGEARQMRSDLKDFQVEQPDGSTLHIDDVPLVLTLPDGQTKTMTYNEFDDEVNDLLDFLGESEREEQLRAAMDEAYANLKEESGYNAKETEMNELQVRAQQLPNEHFTRLRELPSEIRDLTRQLEDESIQFVVPEGVTNEQMAGISPSFTAPENDSVVDQTLVMNGL